jgi:hypothetical protein
MASKKPGPTTTAEPTTTVHLHSPDFSSFIITNNTPAVVTASVTSTPPLPYPLTAHLPPTFFDGGGVSRSHSRRHSFRTVGAAKVTVVLTGVDTADGIAIEV